jgi:hypothetical protein
MSPLSHKRCALPQNRCKRSTAVPLSEFHRRSGARLLFLTIRPNNGTIPASTRFESWCLPARVYHVTACSKRFKRGDRVSWNSEAGRVSGRIVKVHTRDVDYKGYVHHASKDEPQYEIKSDKTDHVALHKGAALRRMRR